MYSLYTKPYNNPTDLIIKLKPKSEFSRNVLTLMTGTTIAQPLFATFGVFDA